MLCRSPIPRPLLLYKCGLIIQELAIYTKNFLLQRLIGRGYQIMVVAAQPSLLENATNGDLNGSGGTTIMVVGAQPSLLENETNGDHNGSGGTTIMVVEAQPSLLENETNGDHNGSGGTTITILNRDKRRPYGSGDTTIYLINYNKRRPYLTTILYCQAQ